MRRVRCAQEPKPATAGGVTSSTTPPAVPCFVSRRERGAPTIKVGRVFTSWASFWGVARLPPSVCPLGRLSWFLGQQLVSELGPQSPVPVHTWVV